MLILFLIKHFVFFPSREFTHRVKSVSMAKFTAQEVTALQEGGNEVASLSSVFLVFCKFDVFYLRHRFA